MIPLQEQAILRVPAIHFFMPITNESGWRIYCNRALAPYPSEAPHCQELRQF